MRIQLSGLSTGPQTFNHTCPAETYFDDRDTFSGDIAIRAMLRSEGNSLHLSLEVELLAHFTCDRCGNPFEKAHFCREDVYYTFEEDEAAGGDESAHVIPKGATDLEIGQEIRDMVVLGLPFKILCSEECRGVCPQCGVNLNQSTCQCQRESVDPRWEALNKLKRKQRKET
jgi:uncharacterized protein